MKRLPYLLTLVTCYAALAADWPQFRGPGGGSSVGDVPLPTEITADSIAWKVELPGRGPSSPIVVDGRVILTACEGVDQERLLVMSFDAATGRRQWRREFRATGRTFTHSTGGNAAPTPASDGERIFAFYSSNDLICLDLEGNLLWYRGLGHDYPKAANDIGMSSSPLVVGETVVVQVENQGDSFVAGIDSTTGENRWRVARAPDAAWSSPIRIPGERPEDDLVLFQSPGGLSAHDPLTGESLWQYSASPSAIPSPTLADDTILFAAEGLTAVRLGENRSALPQYVWNNNRLQTSSSSPVAIGRHVYTVNRTGVVTCGDLQADGDVAWQLRLKGAFWATPVHASGHLYYPNSDGLLQVVKLGEKGSIVSEYDLGEVIQGSPAVAEGALFIRSERHLWKFAR